MAKTVTVRRAGWWEARTLREKRMLVFLAVLLAGVLIWFAVIRPLLDARATAEARLNAAVTELAQARGDAEALKQGSAAPQTGSALTQPLDAFLRQAGAEQGFTNIAVAGASPDRATITIAQVRPAAFFSWIGQLEARGLVVDSMSARANQDQTIAVDAVVRAGGR